MKHIILGTAGHVDHGKTALVKALTGVDCDTHQEEKKRGITINLGFTYLELSDGESVGIIDVPGHKDFINTMVGGASGIDCVMLVIAADSGIMPQTREHMQIINSLGISRGIVALTKSDLVDEELIELASMEVREFLSSTGLREAPIIPVSAITGAGVDTLKAAISHLLKEVEEREEKGQFRMYIDRIFTVKGFGSVVTGSVLGGSLSLNQEVYLQPGDHEPLRVRSLERHGKQVERVVGGDRAAVNLMGLDRIDFKRGMIISDKRLNETTMIDAAITLFAEHARLPLWSHLTFHAGTFECSARMHALTAEKLRAGEQAVVQLHLSKPAVLLNQDKFILRNSSGDTTLGGGFVMDVSPLHHKKRTSALISNLTELAKTISQGNSVCELVKAEIKKDFRPFTLDEVASRLHIKAEDLKAELNCFPDKVCFLESPEVSFLVDKNFFKQYKESVLAILREHHKQYYVFSDGLDLQELAGKLNLAKTKQDKAFVSLLLNAMVSEKLLERKGSTWIISGHKENLDAVTAGHIQWLEDLIRDYDVQKPVITEIEEKALQRRIQKSELKMFLSYLVKKGKVLYVQADFMHSDIVKKYRLTLLNLLEGKADGIEINVFKDAISASKRLCAMLVSVYEGEKIVTTAGSGIETRIYLTPAGKKLLE
jgi:selenocysteine-specific elongation factor